MAKEYIYVKLSDRNGSAHFSEQSISLGGYQNLPTKVEKTPRVVKAISNRHVIVVPEEEALGMLNATVEPAQESNQEKELALKGKIKQALEGGEYKVILDVAKEIDSGIKGKMAKNDLIEILESKL